jgi:hypothetical protein
MSGSLTPSRQLGTFALWSLLGPALGFVFLLYSGLPLGFAMKFALPIIVILACLSVGYVAHICFATTGSAVLATVTTLPFLVALFCRLILHLKKRSERAR